MTIIELERKEARMSALREAIGDSFKAGMDMSIALEAYKGKLPFEEIVRLYQIYRPMYVQRKEKDLIKVITEAISQKQQRGAVNIMPWDVGQINGMEDPDDQADDDSYDEDLSWD